ncbi:preprotein translocase subunit SecE [Patescibacteria group bacterium]|nr:preprotein translocase subunit SecE [Patescibacteria group bacterium]
MFEKIGNFVRESKQELKKVNWPTREETIRYTLFVIGFSVLLAAFLGVLDFVFIQILQRIVL